MVNGPIFNPREVDDAPVDGASEVAISSNWAFDHVEDLDAHNYNAYLKRKTGEYYNALAVVSGGGLALAANTLYAYPFLVARLSTWDRIAISVSAVDAGKFARLGIYEDGADLYPGDLVLDAGIVGVGGGAVQSIVINQQLSKGIYWLAIISDGTPSFYRAGTPPVSVVGNVAAFLTSAYQGWSVAQPYGALPDPFTAGGALSPALYTINLRLSSLD